MPLSSFFLQSHFFFTIQNVTPPGTGRKGWLPVVLDKFWALIKTTNKQIFISSSFLLLGVIHLFESNSKPYPMYINLSGFWYVCFFMASIQQCFPFWIFSSFIQVKPRRNLLFHSSKDSLKAQTMSFLLTVAAVGHPTNRVAAGPSLVTLVQSQAWGFESVDGSYFKIKHMDI